VLELSDTAQHLLSQAYKRARGLGQARVEPEHVFLALSDDPSSTSARILAEAGVDWAGLERVMALTTKEPVDERTPQTAALRLKRALQSAEKLAGDLNSGAVTVDHVLFAIVTGDDREATALLSENGVDADALRGRLRETILSQ